MRDSADSYDPAYERIRRGNRGNTKRHKLDNEDTYLKRDRHLQRLPAEDAADATYGLPEGDRWSTWDQSTPLERGPRPHPEWLVTDLAAVDTELGILKTGKEADVYLVERRLDDRVNILAAKRYRDFEDRMFRNDARYRAARRTGNVRVDKAMAQATNTGKAFRARQWVSTEFETLTRLYAAGVPVPYPVQRMRNEIVLELIGSPEDPAPRLVHSHVSMSDVPTLWEQVVDALHAMARNGVVHGDLSAYNILLDGDRLVFIDFPQAVDPIGHPEGMSLLERDLVNVGGWFAKHGVECDIPALHAELINDAFG